MGERSNFDNVELFKVNKLFKLRIINENKDHPTFWINTSQMMNNMIYERRRFKKNKIKTNFIFSF